MVSAPNRTRESTHARSIRAKRTHPHLANSASSESVGHAALNSRQSCRPLAVAILAPQLPHALDPPQSHTARPRLRSASSQGRACQHRWPHPATYGQTCICALRFSVAGLGHLVSPIPFLTELRYKPCMRHVSYSAALSPMVGAQGHCRGGCHLEPSRVGVPLSTAHRAHSPSTLRRRANPALKRNVNSVARRPASAGPCGPFCARCPARHAVGVRLALR